MEKRKIYIDRSWVRKWRNTTRVLLNIESGKSERDGNKDKKDNKDSSKKDIFLSHWHPGLGVYFKG